MELNMSPLEKYIMKRYENEDINCFMISVQQENGKTVLSVERMFECDKYADFQLNNKNAFVKIYDGEYAA